MSIVVSDTSPIRALHHLKLLDLLPNLFNEVIVPPAVEAELGRVRPPQGPIGLAGKPWVCVRAPADQLLVRSLLSELDRGESEAIALAVELRAELLIDETDGREVAERLGVARVGALGVLSRLKLRGFIPELKPLLDRLASELNFYISDALRMDVLRAAGE